MAMRQTHSSNPTLRRLESMHGAATKKSREKKNSLVRGGLSTTKPGHRRRSSFTKLCIDLADSTSGRKIRRCITRFPFHCPHSLPYCEPRARQQTV